jgi:hypothetical protein
VALALEINEVLLMVSYINMLDHECRNLSLTVANNNRKTDPDIRSIRKKRKILVSSHMYLKEN